MLTSVVYEYERHYKLTRIPTDDRHERRTGAPVVPLSVTRLEPRYQPGTVTEGTTTLFGGSGGIGERTENFRNARGERKKTSVSQIKEL